MAVLVLACAALGFFMNLGLRGNWHFVLVLVGGFFCAASVLVQRATSLFGWWAGGLGLTGLVLANFLLSYFIVVDFRMLAVIWLIITIITRDVCALGANRRAAEHGILQETRDELGATAQALKNLWSFATLPIIHRRRSDDSNLNSDQDAVLANRLATARAELVRYFQRKSTPGVKLVYFLCFVIALIAFGHWVLPAEEALGWNLAGIFVSAVLVAALIVFGLLHTVNLRRRSADQGIELSGAFLLNRLKATVLWTVIAGVLFAVGSLLANQWRRDNVMDLATRIPETLWKRASVEPGRESEQPSTGNTGDRQGESDSADASAASRGAQSDPQGAGESKESRGGTNSSSGEQPATAAGLWRWVLLVALLVFAVAVILLVWFWGRRVWRWLTGLLAGKDRDLSSLSRRNSRKRRRLPDNPFDSRKWKKFSLAELILYTFDAYALRLARVGLETPEQLTPMELSQESANYQTNIERQDSDRLCSLVSKIAYAPKYQPRPKELAFVERFWQCLSRWDDALLRTPAGGAQDVGAEDSVLSDGPGAAGPNKETRKMARPEITKAGTRL